MDVMKNTDLWPSTICPENDSDELCLVHIGQQIFWETKQTAKEQRSHQVIINTSNSPLQQHSHIQLGQVQRVNNKKPQTEL